MFLVYRPALHQVADFGLAHLVGYIAVRQDDSPVAHCNTPLYIVGDEYTGLIVRVRAGKYPVKSGACMLVKAGVRLIEQKYGRVVDQCPSYREALFHPPGERPDAVVLPVAQPYLFYQFVYPGINILCIIHPSEEPQVLCGGQLMVQISLMGYHAYFLPDLDRVLFDIYTIYGDPACGRAYKGGDYFNKSGLSCAIGTEYGQELALLDFEIDVSENYIGTECF